MRAWPAESPRSDLSRRGPGLKAGPGPGPASRRPRSPLRFLASSARGAASRLRRIDSPSRPDAPPRPSLSPSRRAGSTPPRLAAPSRPGRPPRSSLLPPRRVGSTPRRSRSLLEDALSPRRGSDSPLRGSASLLRAPPSRPRRADSPSRSTGRGLRRLESLLRRASAPASGAASRLVRLGGRLTGLRPSGLKRVRSPRRAAPAGASASASVLRTPSLRRCSGVPGCAPSCAESGLGFDVSSSSRRLSVMTIPVRFPACSGFSLAADRSPCRLRQPPWARCRRCSSHGLGRSATIPDGWYRGSGASAPWR